MFQTRKVNEAVVTPLQLSNQYRPDQIYGYDFCRQVHATWLLVARSRSGKGHCIYQILKNTVDPLMKTNVVIFSSTVHRDPLWERILELLENKHCNVTCHSHFLLGKKQNILTELINEMGEGEEPEVEPEKPQRGFGQSNAPKSKRDKKPTKVSSKWVFIFDDLPPSDMRDPSLAFCMRNRHFNCRVIMSVQHLSMLLPSVRKNVSNACIFGSMNHDKLETIHQDLDVGLEYPEFEQIYRFATAKKYGFLQYDVQGDRFLRNFNELIIVPSANDQIQEDEDD